MYFHDNILEKIVRATGCSINRFIFTPGNHDVQRLGVRFHFDKLVGLSLRVHDRDALNDAYMSGTLDDICDSKFKAYNAFLEFISYGHPVKGDRFYQVHSLDSSGVDVVVANTSWMSWGGYEKRNDLRNLLYPEQAIINAVGLTNPGRDKFLITHHPLNWLTEPCESDFVASTSNVFSAHFYGHLHEPRPALTTSLNGRYMVNQSGALFSGRSRYIGYSVTQYDMSSKNVAVHLQAYSDHRREFHSAEQLLNGGVFYPSEEAKKF